MACASQGLCFDIKSQEQATNLFQSEAVLHCQYRERVDLPPAITSDSVLKSLMATPAAEALTEVKCVVNTALVNAPVLSSTAVTAKVTKETNNKKKRILKEFVDVIASNCYTDTWRLFISEENFFQWKGVISGPRGSPYANGRWLVTIVFPDSYPFAAPVVRFVTPIYHCNVSSDGRTCLNAAKDWSPSFTIATLMSEVNDLLLRPNIDDPLDGYKATLYQDNRAEYEASASRMTLLHASHSMEELVATYNLE